MKRKIALLVTAFFISICSYAQKDAAIIKTMLEQANDMGGKFMAKDYAAFLKYSHPATIKTMGGEKKMLEKTTNEMADLEKDGMSFTSIKFGVPSKIIKAGNELQCTIPEIIEVQLPGRKMTSTTTMIAISYDKGKNWYFLDTARNSLSAMQQLVPTLSNELDIPFPSDPSFEDDIKTDQQEIKTE